MTQTNMLDYQPSIDNSLNNANLEWKREAEATIKLLIRIGNDFSADDVIRILDEKGVKTHNNSALGGIMQRFSKDGYIRFLRHVNSTRKSRHGSTVRLWRPMTRLANV